MKCIVCKTKFKHGDRFHFTDKGFKHFFCNLSDLAQIPIKPMPTIEPIHNLIDHPPHYTAGKVEVIDYIVDKLTAEQFEGYCIGNVLKYVSRYRHKGGHEDLKKAVWYLNRVIGEEEK